MKQLAEDAIQCAICKQSIQDTTLYKCLQCNNSTLYCEDCGRFIHQKLRKHHEYSGKNITKVEEIDQTQLQLYQKEGADNLHFLISQFHIVKDITHNRMKNAATGIVMQIRAGGGAAKAAAVNGVDVAVDLTHGIRSMSVNAAKMSSNLSNIGSAMAPVATSAAIATGIVTALELCYITYKFFNGEISDWQTFGRLVTRSIATGVGAFAGNCAGYFAGAMIGGSIGMLLGPGGIAVGAFIGSIIGSIFGGIAGGATAEKVFEKYWPDKEQQARKDMVRDALTAYGYTENDINDDKVFNKRKIILKYKQLCLLHHPDRETGSTHAFQQLAINHGIIWSLLQGPTQQRSDAVKIMLTNGV